METYFDILMVLISTVGGFAAGALLERSRLKEEIDIARLDKMKAKTLLESEQKYSERVLKRQVEALRAEFKVVAADLMRAESGNLRTEHLHTLEGLLRPLGKDIDSFRDQFVKSHAAMERYVESLVKYSMAVGQEAEKLASALKNNTKLQGNWGEAVLANLLEVSGLTKGRDFTVQASTLNEEGRRLIPDVVVHLPDNRNLIIDSKVSLTAFADYANSTDDIERDRRLKDHVASVRRHIVELSDKDYAKTVKGSIGYVLMFIPNEAAYIAAVTADTRLSADAYARRVILLNPTNLLMALQLTYNLWQSEMQSRSVSDIYASAERLYKKFALFSESFVKIGDSIGRLSDVYSKARGQLSTGRGNIISQLEGWKKKGLTPSTEINAALRSSGDGDEETD